MNAFCVSSILIVFSNLSLALFVFSKRKRQKALFLWGTFCLSVSVWGFGGYLFSSTISQKTAFGGWQLAHIGIIFTPILFYHFIYAFLSLNTTYQRYLLIFSYSLGGIFLLLDIFFPRQFFGDLRFVFNQFYTHDWFIRRNFSYLFFYVYFYWLLLLYSFVLLVKHFFGSTGVRRNQIKYLILGCVIGWIGPHGYYPIVFRINFYPFTNFLIAFYTLIITYAIIKYRLMDINLIITRTGIFITVSAVVLGIPFFLIQWFYNEFSQRFGPVLWVVPLLGLMALLASVGPFIYIFLNRRAEAALLREQRRYQNVLKHAAVGMTRIRELGHLLNIIVHIVTKTVRISHAEVYLFDDKSEQFLLEAGRNTPKSQLSALDIEFGLIRWLREHRLPLVYEEIQRMSQEDKNPLYKEMAEQMRLIHASVIVPSVLENKVLGFLVLGEKLSRHLYTDSDLEVFNIVASQAALAIENARFILEAKFIQEQIAHTEKMATIGTMADGLSHQLNNRFHALSLIADDTIDTLKITDISGCTSEIQQVFSQMGYALNRIRNNIIQGAEIVEGILKYTRKGGQNREAVNLDRIINGTLDMLRYKVKLPEIDIILELPHDLPHIMGNLVQLQEVFFNLMDNAYDSMVERKAALQEPGYRGRITLTTEVLKNGRLRIVIGDNGMGVKKEDQKKIFTPFFTTKVSSKMNLQKGTGLGLYVIRRIIVDMHEGDVNFESEYRRGTRFIIDLPIAE